MELMMTGRTGDKLRWNEFRQSKPEHAGHCRALLRAHRGPSFLIIDREP
jgi:hypothetical protein